MRELEKDLLEIEHLIKEHEKRGNTHTQSVLEITHEIISICAKYAKTLPELKSILRNGVWIPVNKQLPEGGKYILLSFSNFILPAVGRYGENSEGGAFYLGDCDGIDTCISQDLYVNAWRPLPEPYRPEQTTAQRPEWQDRMLHTFLGGHE